ncbi:MAG TPA: nucleotidyltransferase family protein [Candidatus Limnocylindria bacterium]|nr:nucleotidyltransferase family protein [Candidatus Limnocylindria bacterium]
MRSVAVVPAAGSAERFGGRKLLTPIDGEPLLDRTISSLLNGGADQVIVVLGPGSDELTRDVNALSDPRVWSTVNPDPERGMFSSLQTGMAEAEGDALLVLPGDMPFVESATVAILLAAYAKRAAIVSPRYHGKRGHPVVLPPALRDEIRAADPAMTLHDILKRHADLRMDVDVSDRGVVRDVDRVADLTG